MKKTRLFGIVMCVVISSLWTAGCGSSGKPSESPASDSAASAESSDSGDSGAAAESSAVETEETAEPADTVKINDIRQMASAKLMAESEIITSVPQEVAHCAALPDAGELLISAIYTKSDMQKDEFDHLHDISFDYYNEEKQQSIKISCCKEEAPLRDYFFEAASNDPSEIAGTKVELYQSENHYVAYFDAAGYHYDVETNGLTEEEMLAVVRELITAAP